MPTERGEWTAEEAEKAFIHFGNLMVQINAIYFEHGTVKPENAREGTKKLLNYLSGLPAHQLEQIVYYFSYIEQAAPDILTLIGMVLLKRQAGIHE